jgi:tetratricopeptide (TPR) repeat protein
VPRGESYSENEAAFHFLLACYDSALGDLDEAKEGLQRAFELDPGFRLKALDERDLEPLWESL